MKSLIKDENGLINNTLDFLISLFIIGLAFKIFQPFLNGLSTFVIAKGAFLGVQMDLDMYRTYAWIMFLAAAIFGFYIVIHRLSVRSREE